MMEVMAILGPYPFGLNTAAFQELNRSTEWKWPSQDVFGNVPARQFVGFGPDAITLPGIIFPEYWGGTGQLDALRALADLGMPQILIDGRGNVLGEYVITGVQERQSVFAAAGAPLRQEFTVSLERYARGLLPLMSVGRGGGAGAQLAANNRATAAMVTTGAIVSDAGALGQQSATGLAGILASIDALVGTVVTPLTGVISAVNQGIGVARSIQTSATVAKQTMDRLGNIRSLSDAQQALNGIILVTGSAAQSATSGSRVIRDTMGAMASAGDAAEAIATVRSAMVGVNRVAVSSTNIRSRADTVVRGFE